MKIAIAALMLASSFSAFSAFNEKGPIWNMETYPVKQSELIRPYYKHNKLYKDLNDERESFYSDYLDRIAGNAPEVLALFKLHGDINTPALANSFPFYNNGDDMKEISTREYGFCLGFSVTLRKMNMLSFFEPSKEKINDVRGYFPIIDRIMKNEPQVIPGFANMLEFSSHPEIARYLKTHIADQWALKNIRGDGIRMLPQAFGSMSPKETRNLYHSLKESLARGFAPIIYEAMDAGAEKMILKEIVAKYCSDHPDKCDEYQSKIDDMLKSKRGKNPFKRLLSKMGSIHVIRAYALTDPNEKGDFSIKTWDINQKVEEAELVFNLNMNGQVWINKEVNVDKDTKMRVNIPIAKVAILPSDKAEIGEMLYNLEKFCLVNRCWP